MKRTTFFSVALAALLLGLLGTYQPISPANARAAASSPATNVQTVPLYRLFSPKTGIHFYTIDVNRKLEAMGAGWTFESVATHVLAQQAPDTVPLYVLAVGLLFAPDGSALQAHAFRYTTNEQEKNQLLQTPPVSRFLGGNEAEPWKLDRSGIAGYVAPSKQFGTVPLYRLYHPERLMEESHGARACTFNSYDTLYTTSDQEMTDAVNNHGYKFVRIEGYVWPQATSVGPHLSAGSATPNADKDLLDRGCIREGIGIYNCPTVASYAVCASYRNSGRVKRCHTSADMDKQTEMDKDLFNRGCKRFLGRTDEFLCETQKALIACEGYHTQGRVKRCMLAH